MKTVSTKGLKKAIKSYNKIIGGRTYSEKLHLKKYDIREFADKVLADFMKEKLHLEPEQHKLFAEFIDTFALFKRNEMLDKLQETADFDVKGYLDKKNRTLWEAFFPSNKKERKPEYMTGRQLRGKYKKYELLRKNGKGGLQSIRQQEEEKKLADEAMSYAKAYVGGRLKLKPEDYSDFESYIDVILAPQYSGGVALKAVEKVAAERSALIQGQDTQDKTSFIDRIKSKFAFSVKLPKFHLPKLKMPKIKMPKLPEFHLPKIKMPKIKMPEMSAETKALWGNRLKKAAVVVAVVISGAIIKTLWSSKDKTDDKQLAKVENASKQIAQNNVDDGKTVNPFSEQSALSAPESEPQALHNVDRQVQNTDEIADLQKSKYLAEINHHNHILVERLGQTQARKLCDKIKDQVEKGIYTLPENISIEHVAYAFVMYRAYGVPSSLKSTLESQTQLSPESNQKLIDEIMAVGSTGEGVRAMAINMNPNNVNTNSDAYNNTSSQWKRQHAKNLKQLREIKQRLQRGA